MPQQQQQHRRHRQFNIRQNSTSQSEGRRAARFQLLLVKRLQVQTPKLLHMWTSTSDRTIDEEGVPQGNQEERELQDNEEEGEPQGISNQ